MSSLHAVRHSQFHICASSRLIWTVALRIGVVVEDAPSGILAGRAAGCKVIAVCTSHTRQQLLDSKPDYIVRDLTRCVRLVSFPTCDGVLTEPSHDPIHSALHCCMVGPHQDIGQMDRGDVGTFYLRGRRGCVIIDVGLRRFLSALLGFTYSHFYGVAAFGTIPSPVPVRSSSLLVPAVPIALRLGSITWDLHALFELCSREELQEPSVCVRSATSPHPECRYRASVARSNKASWMLYTKIFLRGCCRELAGRCMTGVWIGIVFLHLRSPAKIRQANRMHWSIRTHRTAANVRLLLSSTTRAA